MGTEGVAGCSGEGKTATEFMNEALGGAEGRCTGHPSRAKAWRPAAVSRLVSVKEVKIISSSPTLVSALFIQTHLCTVIN